MDLDIDFEIKRLRLQPGDVLVIKLDREPTREQELRLLDQAKALFQHGVKTMVIGPGMSLSTISPAAAADLSSAQG